MSSERTRAWEGGSGSECSLNFDRDFDREVEGGPSPLRILTEIWGSMSGSRIGLRGVCSLSESVMSRRPALTT